MLTFRSSKIVYYGPHACENCGAMIVKMGHEFGGNAFDQPQGPIYPNTEWYPHVCDPKRMKPAPTEQHLATEKDNKKQDFIHSFDGKDWARAFVEHVTAKPSIATDEETMVGWFANAIMVGYDEAKRGRVA